MTQNCNLCLLYIIPSQNSVKQCQSREKCYKAINLFRKSMWILLHTVNLKMTYLSTLLKCGANLTQSEFLFRNKTARPKPIMMKYRNCPIRVQQSTIDRMQYTQNVCWLLKPCIGTSATISSGWEIAAIATFLNSSCVSPYGYSLSNFTRTALNFGIT